MASRYFSLSLDKKETVASSLASIEQRGEDEDLCLLITFTISVRF